MSTRVTRAMLEQTAQTLESELIRAGIITDRERVVLYGDITGWRFDVTGRTIADGTGHRTGVAGLAQWCEPARQANTVARAVIGALYAARTAGEL